MGRFFRFKMSAKRRYQQLDLNGMEKILLTNRQIWVD
jgi:hypothetical protein